MNGISAMDKEVKEIKPPYLNFGVCACMLWTIEGAESKEQAYQLANQRFSQILKDAGLIDKIDTRLQLNQLKPVKKTIESVKIAEYNPDDILEHVTDELKTYKEFIVNNQSYVVNTKSSRYKLFAKSKSCCACGILGSKMILELHINGRRNGEIKSKKAHFNLYAEENGKLILMTKDHIKSLARGGENKMDNYQVMCSICNNLKGSDNLTPHQVNHLRKIYNKYRVSLSGPMLQVRLSKEKKKLLIPKKKKISSEKINNTKNAMEK